MTRSLGIAFLGFLLVLCVPDSSRAQSRKIRKIPRPQVVTPIETPQTAPELPSSEVCETFVRETVARWGRGDLEPLLAADFPNRAEFLDSLERAQLRASRIELRLESIEETRFTPWRFERSAGGQPLLTTYCTAEIRTVLLFDDPLDADRIRRDPGRTQLRIRFVRGDQAL